MPSPSPRFRAAAAILLLTAAAEVVLRRGLPADPRRLSLEERRYLYRESRLPLFRLEAGVWKAARPRARPQAFAAVKAPGERRVFVVGESVALRLPPSALAAAWGSPVTVVNAGMGSYDSALVRRAAEELPRYEPDLLVVMAGNNEGALPRVRSWEAWRLNLALRRSALWRRLQDALPPPRPRGGADADAGFESQLRALLARARARALPVVLCTLPVHGRLPPMGALPLEQAGFRSAWEALEAGDLPGALAFFETFLNTAPTSAMARFYAAVCLERLGRRDEAAKAYQAAVALDRPGRCTPRRNELIRRLAAEEGAALADLDAAFAARAPGGVPGWESFIDEVHWRRSLDAFASGVIAQAAGAGRPARAPALKAAFSLEELDELIDRALSLAVQAGLQDPPVLLERAVAELAFAARQDAARVLEQARGPLPLSRRLEANLWTRALAGQVLAQRESLLRHACEALRRGGNATIPRCPAPATATPRAASSTAR